MKTGPTSSRRKWLVASGVVLLAGTAAVATALAATTYKGNGAVRQQARPATGFHAIELALPAEVEVRLGAQEGLSIETDENLLAHVGSKVDGGVLELGPSATDTRLVPTRLKIVVTAREIRRLGLAGGGTIRVAHLKSPRLDLELAGSGLIDVQQLESERVSAEIGGSGNIRLAGGASNLSIEIAGSGDVKAGDLKAGMADVSIAGSGSALLWPVDDLKVSIAGSGDVRYYGDPRTRTSVAGSGAIRRVGPAPR